MIGAEKSTAGYDVAWKHLGSDLYSIWATDSSGNFLSYAHYSGDDYALQSIEGGFHQDLNSDGQIGLFSTVIESAGVTRLTGVVDEYYLFDSNGTGPALRFNDENVAVGAFGPSWSPIGAEITSAGYQVAWKFSGTDLYSIWNTDALGNVAAYKHYSGAAYGLQALETSFRQDLNSDGQIGPKTSVIESKGATRLTSLADEYYLYNSSAVGPSLKLSGVNVIANQFGSAWQPIGAEAIANGYTVVWKYDGSDLYSIWNTDLSGNVRSFVHALEIEFSLQSLETSFDQDLNSDGTTGAVTRVIETAGASFLTQVADRYYIFDAAGAGPTLSCYDSPVFDGEFTPWAPIAAEATGSGYLVAWKYGATDLYSIWNTDRGGDVTSYVHYSGSDSALKALETAFAQDINGDAIIGL